MRNQVETEMAIANRYTMLHTVHDYIIAIARNAPNYVSNSSPSSSP
ncbi:hypothetical protein [Roseofilum casamattae]|uniref:Uncharacterized protein n=1 Tax=Roseofilum casamattae BLCC-M143 TaxID=3022442 RepID=A0ABT7BRH3_9CYAN|nr:hypothetical protein [Roseofilum casamattae]MDJ1181685.1 hypothetical protein [Roseofilum casamattae BLCC-M143]